MVVVLIFLFGSLLFTKAYFSPSYVHYRVGERFFREGRYRAAYEEFKKAFELDPYNRAARQRLADLKRIFESNGSIAEEGK